MRSVTAIVSAKIFYGAIAFALSVPVYAADKLFAAPEATNVAPPTTGASLSKVTVALVVVLAFVFLAAWVLKQTRKLQQGKDGAGIEIVSQVALGAKERAVLLRVGDAQVLVGVAPGQVRALHVMAVTAAHDVNRSTDGASPASNPVAPAPLSFQSILKRSLGLS